jgi:hypothetical protein
MVIFQNYINYFSLGKLSNQLKQNVILFRLPSNSMSGFENIEQISNYEYLIGTTDGYYTININDLSFKIIRLPFQMLRLNENFKYNSIQEEGSFGLWWK